MKQRLLQAHGACTSLQKGKYLFPVYHNPAQTVKILYSGRKYIIAGL